MAIKRITSRSQQPDASKQALTTDPASTQDERRAAALAMLEEMERAAGPIPEQIQERIDHSIGPISS